ncbi:hypothetical protein M0R45_018395 [Rubus argutus]|uniref:Ubiquitin-like protease family profile domain-containing protein n=1 Tax=Rubus argutus TaxID=59490 RepID=A0AAW1X2C1_RUBAR
MIKGDWLMKSKEKIGDFITTVEALNSEKIEVVNDLGFGSLHKMGCRHLFEDVCLLMMNNIDPLNQNVVINTRCISITTIDFERVMGLKDGGVDFDFCWEVSGSLLEYVRMKLSGSMSGEISLGSLKSVVMERKEVDYIFKAAYVMYAFASVLSPCEVKGIDHMILLPLLKTDKIRDLNWATLCYNKLVDAVLTMRIRPQMATLVCLPFIQLFYFDVVGSSLGWVDEPITPLIYWTVGRATKLVELIGKIGGFGNMPTAARDVVNSRSKEVKELEIDHECEMHGKRTLEELKEMSRHLDCVKKDVQAMKGKMNSEHPTYAEFLHELDKVRIDIRAFNGEAVKNIVNEIMNRCPQLKFDKCQPNERKPDNPKTEVKSNSACFGGYKVGTSKGLLSGDSSCRIVLPKQNPAEAVEIDKGKGGNKHSKGEQVGNPSDCSVSPVAAPKMMRRGRKEKKKSGLAVAPEQIARVLFEERKRKGRCKVSMNMERNKKKSKKRDEGTPHPIYIVAASKADADLMDFIFTERQKPDEYDSVLVAVYEGVHVTCGDLQCLRPRELIYNMVINMFAAYLNESDSEDWFFPTYFSGSALSKSADMSPKEWLVHTFKLSILGRFVGRIGSCRRIFIPMREEGPLGQPAHFYLLVIHVRGRFAEIMDSFPTATKKVSRAKDARNVVSSQSVK